MMGMPSAAPLKSSVGHATRMAMNGRGGFVSGTDSRPHQVPIRDADLHGDPRALASTLARQGLMIVAKHRAQLINYLNALDSDQRIR
jgi:hypothetical protein